MKNEPDVDNYGLLFEFAGLLKHHINGISVLTEFPSLKVPVTLFPIMILASQMATFQSIESIIFLNQSI